MLVDCMLSERETVVELPWAAGSCPCVVEAANRVTSNCWYQRQGHWVLSVVHGHRTGATHL